MYFVLDHSFLVEGPINVFDWKGFGKRDEFESEFSGKVLVDKPASCSTVNESVELDDFLAVILSDRKRDWN